MRSEKQPIWQLDWAIGTVLCNHAIVCLLNFKLPWSTEWWEGTSRTFVVNDYKLHCIVAKWLRFWWTLQRGTKNKVTPGVWYGVVMLCSISLQDDKTISVIKQSSCDHLLDLFEAWNLLTLPRGEIRKVHEVGKAPWTIIRWWNGDEPVYLFSCLRISRKFVIEKLPRVLGHLEIYWFINLYPFSVTYWYPLSLSWINIVSYGSP